MDKCPKCGKELGNGVIKCPDCGTEIMKENVIEEVQVDLNNIISLDDEPEKEETIEAKIEPEQINQQSEPTPKTQVAHQEVQTEEKELSQETITEVIPEEEPKTLETQQELIVAPQEQFQLEETSIINDNLETISVDAANIKLEEEKKEEVVIEIPEMPEPTIGEINPDLLGNNYDEAERINNEKIEAKRQAELAELERKRQEEEARRQAAVQAGKPDLLAGRDNGETDITETSKKKKKGKVGKTILIILILAVIAFALFYFLVLRKS